MLAIPLAQRTAGATRASVKAAEVLAERIAKDPLRVQFGDEAVKMVSHIGTGARTRCVNKNMSSFENYGGRGIEFRFPTSRAFAEWVLYNLGPKPSPLHSIDRIDNNRHYEPGNLRWATRTEQARNKRAYRRTVAGERIRRLQALRPDYTYETLRTLIAKGATDDEIIQKVKYAHSSI